MEEDHKKEVLDSISITLKEDSYIEYGSTEVDFVDESFGNPAIHASKSEIDTMVLGSAKVIFEISKEGYMKERFAVLKVIDTQPPEITLKEDSVNLSYGSGYDIKSNIIRVKDPVDGDIPFEKEQKSKNNYYTVEGFVDSAKAGYYVITIKAVGELLPLM